MYTNSHVNIETSCFSYESKKSINIYGMYERNNKKKNNNNMKKENIEWIKAQGVERRQQQKMYYMIQE